MFGVKGKLLPFECDITDEHQIKACFRYIGEKYDGIDLLVRFIYAKILLLSFATTLTLFQINNANVMTKGLILDDNNTDEMNKIMETNILALCVGSLISQVINFPFDLQMYLIHLFSDT